MTGVRLIDSVGVAMRDVVWSDEARLLMLAATKHGRPPLEAIDHLLHEAVGKNYGKHNGATSQAGYLVTRRMRELGYKKTKQVAFGEGTVARSGVLFEQE
jgi:hypothetical protein